MAAEVFDMYISSKGESGSTNCDGTSMVWYDSIDFFGENSCCVAGISEMDGPKEGGIARTRVMLDRDTACNGIWSPCLESRQEVLCGH